MASDRLPAVTLSPEWAYGVAHLGKSPENRTWYPPKSYTGDLAIHAGSTRSPAAVKFITRLGLSLPDLLVTGAVVAVVHVGGHHLESVCDRFFGCSPWAMFAADGAKPLCHWELSNVRLLTPIPATGRLGWWSLPPAVHAEVEQQLARSVAR